MRPIREVLIESVQFRKDSTTPEGWLYTRYRENQIDSCRADISLDLLRDFIRDRETIDEELNSARSKIDGDYKEEGQDHVNMLRLSAGMWSTAHSVLADDLAAKTKTLLDDEEELP